MQVLCKGRFFVTNYVWFENIEKIGGGGYDKIIINASDNPVEKIGKEKCISSTRQETLCTDLSASDDILWSQLTKTVRNEINRSKREDVKICFYPSNLISEKLLDEFESMYIEMYASKNIKTQGLNRKLLKAYIENNALLISVAYINGNPFIYHSYVCDKIHARLLHSCSAFREKDNVFRNAIGRANKYLHWSDWLYLKGMGVTEYDWGGISSYHNPNGIDKFKMSFGGEYRAYFNLLAACSWKAKIQYYLKNIRRKSK